MNLGMLTLYTGMSPAVNVSIDTGVYKLGSDELLNCSDFWVRQTVKGVKHNAPPC